MLDLYNLQPQYWPDKSIPRVYLTEDEKVPSQQEILDTVKYILQNNLIKATLDTEIEEEETVLCITVDNDDNSLFTVFMGLVELLPLKIDLTWYKALDEIMECIYLDPSSNSIQNFNTLINSIKNQIN